MAASGANLQYILTAPRCLVQGRSWRLWQLVSLGTILWYWQVAEQSGSLWRAIMMWGSLWLATWWGRAGSRVYIWILTTLVSAGLRPEQLSHSYWLSSLAIGGVLFSQILISSENNNRLLTNYEKRMRGWSKSYLQGSVVFAMVAGYLWWQWQSWQPVGILTTLLLDPVVPAYIGVSSGLLLADWLGIPQVETWSAQGQRWLFVVVVAGSEICEPRRAPRCSVVRVFSRNGSDAARRLGVVATAAPVATMARNAVSLKVRILLLCFSLATLLALWKLSAFPVELKIVACDVGQGDAILIQYGSMDILIDSGRNEAILPCLRQEIFWADRTIDVAIVTHWDEDHCGGFASVLNEYAVKEWWYNPAIPETAIAQALFHQIQNRGKSPQVGDSLALPGLELRVVWSESARGLSLEEAAEDRNAGSIAVLLTTESFGFFSSADLECPQQLAIIEYGLLKQVEILKVAHHGAKSGTCPELLAELGPEIGIVSVGVKNSYGHPTPETLKLLDTYGVFAWRTDQHGSLRLWWDPVTERLVNETVDSSS